MPLTVFCRSIFVVATGLVSVLVLLSTTTTTDALQSDIFQTTFTATLSPPTTAKEPHNETELRDAFRAAIHSGLTTPSQVVEEVTFLTNVTISVEVIAIVLTNDNDFSTVWGIFDEIKTNVVTSTLGLALNGVALNLNGNALTFDRNSVEVRMPCRSTEGGVCYDGSNAEFTFSVTMEESVGQGQLLNSFCTGLALTPCDQFLSVASHSAAPSGPTQATFKVAGLGFASDKFINLINSVQRGLQPTLTSQGFSKLRFGGQNSQNILYSKDEVSIRRAAAASGGGDEPCELSDYWWLIFFFALIPLSLIVVRGIYRQGRLAGIEAETKVIEDEKRREEQLSLFLQQNPGVYASANVTPAPQGTSTAGGSAVPPSATAVTAP